MNSLRNILFLIILLNLISCEHNRKELEERIKIASDSIISLRPENVIPTYYDTLIDLNGDNIKELLFEYYGLTGSGENNRIEVYEFDSTHDFFKKNETVSDISNPTFNNDNNTICGYYIGNGGGEAYKYYWDKDTIFQIEDYEIEIDSIDSIYVYYENYQSGKRDIFIWNQISLPKEYMFGNYREIIKEK